MAPPAAVLPEPQPRYRIGAVARMLRMPVATLRVWERRYQVTRPQTSAAGHRLYSAAEVQRLGLLRQLVTLGHAVGALAQLDMAGLHTVAATHARAVAQPVPVPVPVPVPALPTPPGALAEPGAGPPAVTTQSAALAPAAGSAAAGPTRGADRPALAQPRPGLVLLGDALNRRLSRPVWQRWLAERWQLLAALPGLDDAALSDAAAAPDAAVGPDAPPVPANEPPRRALLASLPTLQVDQVAALAALARRWQAGPVLVLYRFAGPGARAALQAAGLAGQVQPADDAGWQRLVQAWLNQARPLVCAAPGAPAHGAPAAPAAGVAAGTAGVAGFPPAGPGAAASTPGLAGDTLPEAPPRRYSDATLTDLAALSTTIVCECPAHVAELLMALSHFEAYSAECADRSPTDAEMHQHLRRVAGTARALFERALARLAVHEGLILPDGG